MGADPIGRTERRVYRWSKEEVRSGLAYFIAKAAHSCSNGLLDNFQGVKPIERVSEARNGDQFHEGKERGGGTNLRLHQEPQVSGPSASRDMLSLCGGVKAALPRRSLSFWIMTDSK
jgi:hypothetical protein